MVSYAWQTEREQERPSYLGLSFTSASASDYNKGIPNELWFANQNTANQNPQDDMAAIDPRGVLQAAKDPQNFYQGATTCSGCQHINCICTVEPEPEPEPEFEQEIDLAEFSDFAPELELRVLSPMRRVEMLMERGEYGLIVQYLHQLFDIADPETKIALTPLIRATIEALEAEKSADIHDINALAQLVGDQPAPTTSMNGEAPSSAHRFAAPAAPAPAPAA